MPKSAPPLAELTHLQIPEPHPSRVADIRRWMVAAAQSPDAPVAGLALTITASGQIQTAVRGIEPEHADLVLERLDEIRALLKAWADAAQAPQLPLCSVLYIRS